MSRFSYRRRDRVTAEALADAIWMASGRVYGMPEAAAFVADELVGKVVEDAPFAQASGMTLITGLAGLWRDGWQPVDVWQITRRQIGERAAEFTVGAIAAEAVCHADATRHPRWQAQLAQLGAMQWWRPDEMYVGAYAERHGLASAGVVELVLQVVAQLRMLPKQPLLIPPPGSYTGPGAASKAPSGPPADGVDPKMLAKVRALLAKAEATDYPDEADAFFAKAQELMSRYSLERAVIDAMEDSRGLAAVQTGGRRIWLDNPYLSPKSMLVNAVANANRCQAVFDQSLGFVTVVGEDTDTEIVDMLATSLLVQAGRAMLSTGARVDQRGRSRTKSFRQSFLVSYAQRIGERLVEASDHARSEVVASLGDSTLLPVLAAREVAVQERMSEYFPKIVTRRISVSSSAGWVAGRAAADLANLDVRSSLKA
ncbi:DUF2786 domain-containing protein [Pseudonocardia spinosispora]|uniref:DUF2786 domain-containing protein n=1 Tax=Pseudonocardia spinosispora TaxID=103441 RepID=UPI0004228735|nr:DUF2786 domain-containing protein [Pseudonocardia spinosispora]